MQKIAKGRPRGENHHRAVLTNQEVEKVRCFREELLMTYKAIAEIFEVSKQSIADICQYRRR